MPKTITASVCIVALISVVSAKNRECCLSLINSEGKTVRLAAEIADDDEALGRGLMYRKYLAPDAGMLFVFPRSQPLSFWMMNTSIPLAIAYISDKFVITEIRDMNPLDPTPIVSKVPCRYALEVNRGWFARHKIVPGCRVVTDGCFRK